MAAFETAVVRISVRNGDPDERIEVELAGINGGLNSILTKKRIVCCRVNRPGGLPTAIIKIHSLQAGNPILAIRSPTDCFAPVTITTHVSSLIQMPASPQSVTLDQEDDTENDVRWDLTEEGTKRPATFAMATSSVLVVDAYFDPEDEEAQTLNQEAEPPQKNPHRPRRIHLLIAAVLLTTPVFLPSHMMPYSKAGLDKDTGVQPFQDAGPVSDIVDTSNISQTEPIWITEPQACIFYKPSMLRPVVKSQDPDTLGKHVVLCEDGVLYVAGSSELINNTWVHTKLTPYTQ